jgi:hypothetical protein
MPKRAMPLRPRRDVARSPERSTENDDAFVQPATMLANAGAITNMYGANGSDNLGFYDRGTKSGMFSGEQRFGDAAYTNAGRSATGDVMNAAGAIGGDAFTLATMDSGEAAKKSGRLQQAGLVARIGGTAARGFAGGGMQAKHGVTGTGTRNWSNFGNNADTASTIKGYGDGIANVGSGLVFAGKVAAAADRYGAYSAKAAQRGFDQRGTGAKLDRLGRAGIVAADLAQTGASAVTGAARPASWLGAGSGAAAVAGTAMTASGVGTAVVGGVQAIGGAVKLGRATYRKGQLDALSDRMNRGSRATADTNAAVAHVREIQDKRQKRGALDMVTGGMMVAGGVLAATGVGLIPGLALGAIGGGIALGRYASRKIQTSGRDKKAAKIDALNAKAPEARTAEETAYLDDVRITEGLRDKKARGESLSFSERMKLAFSFNENKSSAKKEAKNAATANAISGMRTSDQRAMVGALGIDTQKFRQRKIAARSTSADDDTVNAPWALLDKGLKAR